MLCDSNNSSVWESVPPYNYVKCNECGLIYASPRNSKAAQKQVLNNDGEYWVAQSKLGKGAPVLSTQKNETRKVNFVKEWIKKGRLLDVGSAYGGFLTCAKERGFDVTGVEIAEPFGFKAKDQGLNILLGDILEVDLTGKAYDVVTLWDTIEHLSQPLETLKKLHKHMNNGALLFIFTPNAEGTSAFLFGNNWWVFQPEFHLVMFSQKTLRRMVEKAGFKVKMVRSLNVITRETAYKLNYRTLLSRESYLSNGKRTSFIKVIINISLKIIDKIFPSFTSLLNIGDDILLVAQK